MQTSFEKRVAVLALAWVCLTATVYSQQGGSLMSTCIDVCKKKACATDIDEKRGCNQMYSCSHGCKMRDLELDEQTCKTKCERDGQSGCFPVVKDYKFELCGPCTRTSCNGWPKVEECKTGCSNYGPFIKMNGANTCSQEMMIKDIENCKKAGAALSYPFAKSVTQYASSFGGSGRPGGCFWDQNGRSYFNTNFQSTASWAGVGGICTTGWVFQSYNYGTYYLSIKGENQAHIQANIKTYWQLVSPGLTGEEGSVSFMSADKPNFYLRHSGFLLYLHHNDNSQLFKSDATFLVRNSKFFEGFTAFESSNYRGYFLRHQNYRIKLHKLETSDLYKKDASWKNIA
jgi:hypothetical protein